MHLRLRPLSCCFRLIAQSGNQTVSLHCAFSIHQVTAALLFPPELSVIKLLRFLSPGSLRRRWAIVSSAGNVQQHVPRLCFVFMRFLENMIRREIRM